MTNTHKCAACGLEGDPDYYYFKSVTLVGVGRVTMCKPCNGEDYKARYTLKQQELFKGSV